jgi:hypothetical protein
MRRKSLFSILNKFICEIFTSHNIGVPFGNDNVPFKYNENVLFVMRSSRKIRILPSC